MVPVVLIYGIFLALSSYNLKRIEKRTGQEVFKQAKSILEETPKISYLDLADKIQIPWDEVIKSCSFFPYVSRETDLWVSRTNLFNVRKIIMLDDSRIKTILERKGIDNFREKSAIRKNLYLEQTHRVTGKRER